MKRTAFFVSDSTGITAETLGRSLLTQFDDIEVKTVSVPFVAQPELARELVERVAQVAAEDGARPIVFSTLTDQGIYEIVAASEALVLDLFSVFIRPLEIEFNLGSTHASGRSHGMANRASYEVRMEAVSFALQHDDGASTRHYNDADLIMVGVSRSGKTPTCVYLAMQFGLRAANYPMTEDDISRPGLPHAVAPYTDKLFGLSIDPERLRQVRGERQPNSRYASLSQCRKEVKECEALLRREGVPLLDTTNLSVEEIASRILLKTGIERRLR